MAFDLDVTITSNPLSDNVLGEAMVRTTEGGHVFADHVILERSTLSVGTQIELAQQELGHLVSAADRGPISHECEKKPDDARGTSTMPRNEEHPIFAKARKDIPDDVAVQETDGVKARIHGLMYGNPPSTLRDWASYRATQLLTRLDDAVTDAALAFSDFVIRLVRKLEG